MQSNKPYEKKFWPLTKTLVLISIFLKFDFYTAAALSIIVIAAYREIIAMVLGLKPLPALDYSNFLSDPKQVSNIMSVVKLERVSANFIKERFR